MSRLALIALSALWLSACREDLAERPGAVDMTAETLGHYCQMQLAAHDGPKGQIHLDGLPEPIFFAQVRDTLAYLHMPEQSHAVRATYVQDMTGATWAAPGAWIAAEKATYVVGSDRRGGMGAIEIVPFSDNAAARQFIADHGGSLRRFSEIAAADVLTDDAPAPAPEGDIAARLNALTNHGDNH